ncbi:MAG: NHL repeat-containing protein [Planctomycetota bacterium]|jgi:hypothetical protein
MHVRRARSALPLVIVAIVLGTLVAQRTLTSIRGAAGAATDTPRPAPRDAVAPAGEGVLGAASVLPDTQGRVGGTRVATRAVLARPATVTALTAFIDGGAGGPVRYALYADAAGEPGRLLARSPVASAPPGGGWLTIGIAPVSLDAGPCWLALCADDADAGYRYAGDEGRTRHVSGVGPGPAFKETWGVSTTGRTRRVSIYATCLPAAGSSAEAVATAGIGAVIDADAAHDLAVPAVPAAPAVLATDAPLPAIEVTPPVPGMDRMLPSVVDDVAVDADGVLYLACNEAGRVVRLDPATGAIETIADRAAADLATFAPAGLDVDADGAVLVADRAGHRVLQLEPGTWRPSVIVGTGTPGFGGDGGAATRARLRGPGDVLVAADGGLLVADTGNHRVRRVDPVTGRIGTIAGSGVAGHFGDGGPARLAGLDGPDRLVAADGGAVRVRHRGGRVVRRIDRRGAIATEDPAAADGMFPDVDALLAAGEPAGIGRK